MASRILQTALKFLRVVDAHDNQLSLTSIAIWIGLTRVAANPADNG